MQSAGPTTPCPCAFPQCPILTEKLAASAPFHWPDRIFAPTICVYPTVICDKEYP